METNTLNYEAYRITFQSSEQCARALWTQLQTLQNHVPLAEKHEGMCIDVRNVLQRMRGPVKGIGPILAQDLTTLAQHYYAGDIAHVDKFLQFYALDNNRPEQS